MVIFFWQVDIMIWQVNINNWQVNIKIREVDIIIWQVMAEICHHTLEYARLSFPTLNATSYVNCNVTQWLTALPIGIKHFLLSMFHTKKKKIIWTNFIYLLSYYVFLKSLRLFLPTLLNKRYFCGNKTFNFQRLTFKHIL